jgi:hypothetical protein
VRYTGLSSPLAIRVKRASAGEKGDGAGVGVEALCAGTAVGVNAAGSAVTGGAVARAKEVFELVGSATGLGV